MKTKILPYPTKSGRIHSNEVVKNHRVYIYGPLWRHEKNQENKWVTNSQGVPVYTFVP